MIILVAGASHTGKTALAQRLLERFRYPVLSLDLLKMGLIRSGKTALTPEDGNLLIPYLWGIVSEMVKTAIENDQNSLWRVATSLLIGETAFRLSILNILGTGVSSCLSRIFLAMLLTYGSFRMLPKKAA